MKNICFVWSYISRGTTTWKQYIAVELTIQRKQRKLQSKVQVRRSGSGHKQKEEMDDISKELSCMDIYDAHSFCISVRSQLNQIRRYGKLQSCDVLFQDWKKCMYAKLTADVDKKQVSNKY